MAANRKSSARETVSSRKKAAPKSPKAKAAASKRPQKSTSQKAETPARGRGRPSKFHADIPQQAFKLCLLGADDRRLADFFDVSEQTLNTWKKQHPEFLEALKRGKAEADAAVANSLYHKALGYEHDTVKVFQHQGKPVIVPVREKFAPDTTAAIFWLKNRQKDHWRDRQDIDHGVQKDNPLAEFMSQVAGKTLRPTEDPQE